MKPLSELSNAELNEVFCIEALGWTRDSSGDETVWLNAAGKYTCGIYDVEFAQSLDAVLPFALKEFQSITWQVRPKRLIADTGNPDTTQIVFNGETFARSLCIALIEAARMKKGTE